MQFLGWTNQATFEGQQGIETRQAINNETRLGVFEFPWTNPQQSIDRLPAILAAGNGQAVPGGLGAITGLAGPYGHLAEMMVAALADHKIDGREASDMALELAHVTGAEAKVKELVAGLISKLTGRK